MTQDPRSTPLPFDTGVEVIEGGMVYVDWLVAGGAPIQHDHEHGWADTQKDEVT